MAQRFNNTFWILRQLQCYQKHIGPTLINHSFLQVEEITQTVHAHLGTLCALVIAGVVLLGHHAKIPPVCYQDYSEYLSIIDLEETCDFSGLHDRFSWARFHHLN